MQHHLEHGAHLEIIETCVKIQFFVFSKKLNKDKTIHVVKT